MLQCVIFIFLVVLCMACLFNNIRKIGYPEWLHMTKRIIPALLFFVVTYAIFTPSSIFLENINEFAFSYIKIVPIVLFVALLLCMGIILIPLCIMNEKSVGYYIAFIFCISFCTYFQGNFLNPKLPTLDGTEINWSSYSIRSIVSTFFWALCIIIIFLLYFYKKDKVEKGIKYISYFLSAVQIVSLLVLIMTNRLQSDKEYGFLKEGEFSVGSEENVVLFVIDTLEVSTIEEYISSDAYIEGQLDDFTFFDNVVSGGSPTSLGMPVLLTGIERDPLQPAEEYVEEIWEEASLYDRMHEKGYDIRFYSDSYYSIPGVNDMVIDNYTKQRKSIEQYDEFGRQLYKLVNFYVMPQFLKDKFWLSTDELLNTIETSENCYSIDNIQFYEDMQDAKMSSTDYKNTFRLYHLHGVHAPYVSNERLERVDSNSVTEQQVLQGVMKEIWLYIESIRELGIYDASTIIITGDHGRHEYSNVGAHPAFLIKRPYEQHELEYNSVPVHFRNITATIAETFMDDYSVYGPSIYDLTEESDIERLHTIDTPVRDRNWVDDEWDKAEECRLITPYNLDEQSKYQVWDPYNINDINYKLGEDINFNTNNAYAEQINYRLYKENETAIASNELSICFNLVDYKGGGLEFHYTYSKVYNNEQNIRVYVNGNRIATTSCNNENIYKDNTIVIPEEKIQDDIVIIRMVFPNAVTPNQIDRTDTDTRVLSIAFDSMSLNQN